ncbi:MAG: allophanate hydrolase-related protein [Janthinobacterium lividum]
MVRRWAGSAAACRCLAWWPRRRTSAALVAALPRPMSIGAVKVVDGRELPGFLVEAGAVEGAPGTTAYGGRRAYLAYLEADRPSRSSIRASRADTAASLPWSVGT